MNTTSLRLERLFLFRYITSRNSKTLTFKLSLSLPDDMEFKFRAIDEQASTYLPPSSSISYFTEQALRVSAGYTGPDFGRPAEFFRNPSDVREAIQRELEKERIREEIIAAEIVRERLLEAEVRREMLLEREMALRRAERFSLFSGSAATSAMRFEPRLSLLHQSEGRSLEERLALSLEERLGSQSRRVFGGFEMLHFQRNAEPKISEVKPPSEVSKEKVIFMTKPEGSLSGAKRKAVTPPVTGASELPSVSLKKPKEEWSCAICQVSATSERGLNEHLQGKKHKAREAGLRALRTGKNYAIGLFPKKTGKPVKLAETTNNENSKPEEKLEVDSLQVNKTGEILLQKKSNAEDVKQNCDLALRGKKNKNGNSAQKMQQKTGDYKRRFTFWCEMCQIGAYSEKVMNAHSKGKKHVGRLQELNQNGGCVPAAQVEEAPWKENDSEVFDKEETRDNVDGTAEGEAMENHQAAEDAAGNSTG